MSLEKIRDVVAQHGRLPVGIETIADDSDLYNAGLTSLATVGLMLALEDAFDVEFPENMLSRKTFESIEAISEAIEELKD